MIRKKCHLNTFLHAFIASWTFGMCFFAFSTRVNAQTSPVQAKAAKPQVNAVSNSQYGSLVSQIEKEVSVIMRQILQGQELPFVVSIGLTDRKSTPVPYVPTISSGSTALDWRTSVKSIELTIYALPDYDKKLLDSIQYIVKQRLMPNSPDNVIVKFQQYTPPANPSVEALKLSLTRLESDVRRYKDDLSRAKELRDVAEKEAEKLQKKLAEGAPVEAKRPEAPPTAPTAAVENPGASSPNLTTLFIAAGAILTVGIIMAMFTAFRISNILARSIRDFGSTVSGSISSLAPKFAKEPAGDESLQAARSVPSENIRPHESASQEDVRAALRSLQDDLRALSSEENETIVLSHISAYIESQQIERAVALLELCGSTDGTSKFSKLGASHQRRIRAFLKTGFNSQAKLQTMLDAGESLKTTLTLASLDHAVINQDDSLTGLFLKLRAHPKTC